MGNVRPWVKVALTVLVVAIIAGAIIYLRDSGIMGGSSDSGKKGGLFGNKMPTYTVGVNTYAGFTPIIWLNGGLKPNEESVIAKEYGIMLNIVIQDDFIAGRNGLKKGEVDMIYCTADALPTEMSESGDMTDVRHFMLLNWSRGADAIVVNRFINTVADLKGKKIAVAEGTAAHTLLINTLETNEINPDEITLVKVENGVEAAQMFKALQVDACVTWSPDDIDCVEAVKGAKVLLSTKQATNIICDGLIAKEDFLDKNQDDVAKIVSAILYANSKMNDDPSAVKEAAGYFAKGFGTDEAFCIEGVKNIRFATLGDELNFYGLNTNYTGVKGDDLYSKMARVYESLKLTKKPMAWRRVSYPKIIEKLEQQGNIKGDQSAEAAATFSKASAEVERKEAISNKKLTINFAVAQSGLSNDAKGLIDQEFVSIAKQFSGARIRVEGNTDNTGNYNSNVALSKQRAQSVVDYLVREYQFDRNRFIVVGNGPKHAVDNGVVGSDINYRTTDFQLVTD
ncbi:MAG: phosphate ABC transporter substrate-binding/OmpA family protein [Dysgonomonas sp.]|jgi:NitT/TauT family transport system substrate-binding protein|nr:OmpA family protein [Prevotella sp.]MDR3057723.1 OmpA family protein [Prevotella sp.]